LANLFQIIKDGNNNLIFNLSDSISFNITDRTDNYYTVYKVKPKDTYHNIAYKFYGDRHLWWIITKFNNVKDVCKLPKQGTTLKILSVQIKNQILSLING
jgi:nucleoid-associated protein YgaU